jgi:membrane fusion protein, copper/silver efflux system
MTKTLIAGTAIAAVLIAAVGGYRAGSGGWPNLTSAKSTTSTAAAPQSDGHAGSHSGETDGATPTALSPNSTGHEGSHSGEGKAEAMPAAANEPRKLLYYRNPMGLPDTSPSPKKDSMGMDYIAVYADEADSSGGVKVSLDKVQRAGVRSEPASLVTLSRTIRAPGIAKPDERSLRTITLRADGFIEKLYANEHGKHVKAGEPLFRIYSQDMLRAFIDMRLGQIEVSGRKPLYSAEQKLRNFEIPQSVIDAARRSKELPMSFDWPSPVTGVIMEKKAIEGQMAKMGDELFRIGDLSNVWVVADVPEQDLGAVKIGAAATVSFRGLAGETFPGKVTFILHELDHAARTGKVRIEVANRDHRIKHEMYADVEVQSSGRDDQRLAVPVSAVIDSGNRQVVLLDRGEGRFEPRAIKLGLRGDAMVEVLDGLKAGDLVVTTANFLIDAESNLKAALSGFATDSPNAAPPTPEPMTMDQRR